MPKRMIPLTILLALILSLPQSVNSANERRIALVIGNSNYTDAPLRNPVNDATDVASALKELGFSVTLLPDANQRSMEEAIRDFGNSLRSGGVGLFYFAGHGIQYRGRNYLIPVHANLQSEADVKYRTVDAGYVLAQMEEADNGLNIIILDACRNNPFARSFRSSEQGLAKMDAPTGSILAYATAPGSVAADGSGRNGLYTEKLLKYMRTPGLEIGRFFRKVRAEVVYATGQLQVPWESSSLIGDFYFMVPRGVSVTERQPADIVMASISQEVAAPGVIATDGQYQQYENGVVADSKSGLEWYSGLDRNMSWHEASSWATNLSVAGDGWRLPTFDELHGLFRKGAGGRNITPLINTTGWQVWSNQTSRNYKHMCIAVAIKLSNGDKAGSYCTSTFSRAIAVRNRD